MYLTRNKYYLKSKLSSFPPLCPFPNEFADFLYVYVCMYVYMYVYIYMSGIQFEGKLSSFVPNWNSISLCVPVWKLLLLLYDI